MFSVSRLICPPLRRRLKKLNFDGVGPPTLRNVKNAAGPTFAPVAPTVNVPDFLILM